MFLPPVELGHVLLFCGDLHVHQDVCQRKTFQKQVHLLSQAVDY